MSVGFVLGWFVCTLKVCVELNEYALFAHPSQRTQRSQPPVQLKGAKDESYSFTTKGLGSSGNTSLAPQVNVLARSLAFVCTSATRQQCAQSAAINGRPGRVGS
jgi:hypothetical protein